VPLGSPADPADPAVPAVPVPLVPPSPPLAGQFPLGLQRRLPVFVLGRQVLVGHSAIGPELFVFNGITRAAERFGVECGRRRDQSGLDEGRQARRDVGVANPRGGAGVEDVP